MTPERYQQINRLTDAALELAVEERAAFLDQACAGDEQLRRQVERLIEAHAHEESFLTSPALEAVAKERASTPAGPLIGQKLGHYQLLSLLGVGGMGEVYRAEDLKLGRQVALKFLPPDTVFDTQARRRFLREARAASALNHPNIVTIHAIEESEGLDFIVMEYVEGETLKANIERGPMELQQVITLGLQVADAAEAAHQAGIIHRDLKPANILVTPQDKAKVLDFGLAKRFQPTASEKAKPDAASMSGLTSAGIIVGTVAYMSPEQTRGEEVDARSDIFSLGCVLYEAATGRRPFDGPSALAIMHEIATVDPPSPSTTQPGLPPEFDSIIQRALAKEKGERYGSAAELAEELKGLSLTAEARRKETSAKERRKARSRAAIIASVAALVIAVAGLWFYWRNANLKWARASIAQIEELAGAEKYFEAYLLALKVKQYLPHDPALVRLVPMIADDLSVASEPAGARVYLKRFTRAERGQSPSRQLIGTTPISNLQIARDAYIIEIEKDGYAPIRRSVSSALDRVQKAILGPAGLRREVKMIETRSGELTMLFDSHAPIRIQAKLITAAEAPDRCVFVPGGEYRLVSYGKPTDAAVRLDDYFIDQFEVTNREYKEFINAGGYLKRQFWKYPFRKDGKELAWEEARRHFNDRTGLPGPRSWSNQNFPEGKEDHPVTDVTWYEAAAYAEFRGKRLPTVFQWEKAARNGTVTHLYWFIMPWGLNFAKEGVDDRANFLGSSTVPVESLEFGMSPYGCYHMAGNVAEWCLNPQAMSFTTAGGSWKDPHYIFASFGAYPGFYSANTLGFRCVLNSPQAMGDQGATPLNLAEEIPTYRPTSGSQFQAMLRHYQYDRTPLDPQIEEVREADAWRREKITYAGAGGERALAYLYLPKNMQRPVQVIHYVPSDAAYYGLTVPDEVETHAAPYIKAGRAVFAVVLKGYKERPRPPGFTLPKRASVMYREMVIDWATDHRRGLDYLGTRDEIDPGKIACYGVSVNPRKLTLIAVETRYAAVILLGAGLMKSWAGMIPEADGTNFAPHIRAPKLMMQGRFDEVIPYKTEAEPLYKLLREPKQLLLFDQGHVPPLEVSVPSVNGWLDKTLGPVKRE
jgi:formylglycine-generating enzyme required for sulfatase activity/predicted Ser/Thr protein kinase/pimeloyl-ACP methyl ester carboxylesterase